MNETALRGFFLRFPMRRARVADLDDLLAATDAPLTILFLWGRDCPNCEVAKLAILNAAARFQWPQVRWLHGNVYEEAQLGTRFGLHGIPAFIVFHGTRKIGRISEWPGVGPLVDAIEKQIAALP